MLRISRRYAPYLIAVSMGLSMGLMMSGVMTLINVGMAPNFFNAWGKSFLGGIIIGIPTALIVSPIVTRLVNRWTVNE